MGITARQQRVFDKNQSTAKSMKEAVALQEKNVYANAEKNLKKLKAGKLGKNSRTKDSFESKKAYLKENTARIKAGDKTTPTYAQWLNKPKKKKEKKYKFKLNEAELSAHYKKPYLKAGISESNLKVLRPNLYKDKK